jgi:hypothetical protein
LSVLDSIRDFDTIDSIENILTITVARGETIPSIEDFKGSWSARNYDFMVSTDICPNGI